MHWEGQWFSTISLLFHLQSININVLIVLPFRAAQDTIRARGVAAPSNLEVVTMSTTNHQVLRPEELKSCVCEELEKLIHKHGMDDLTEIVYHILKQAQFSPHKRLDGVLHDGYEAWCKERDEKSKKAPWE